MSWSPAYFAAGEILHGTISGLFFNLINIKDTERLYVVISSHNENPLLENRRLNANILNEYLINIESDIPAIYPIYIGALYVADIINPSVRKNTIWVNTTEPLPAN